MGLLQELSVGLNTVSPETFGSSPGKTWLVVSVRLPAAE